MNETTPSGNEDRLDKIEQRLTALEALLAKGHAEAPVTKPAATPAPLPVVTSHADTSRPPRTGGRGLSVTAVLGWGGVAALVLATAYLIRLAIESGWLTPARQVAIAGTFGLGLIVTGMAIRKSYRRYGSLLPAGGIVVLFLTVYGAHLYHRLIGPLPAAAGVVLICLGALALREFYQSDFYVFFAVVGSFTGPLLMHELAAHPEDLIIYFGAWDLVFCAYSLRARSRTVYLVSAYLAFVVFDATWRSGSFNDWVWAFGFQTGQLIIYSAMTAVYSIRNRAPLTEAEGIAHVPVLLFYYGTQYALLHGNIPGWAPWIAITSIAPIALVYAIARRYLGGAVKSGEVVLTAYAALALFHAGYVELVPAEWNGVVSFLAGGVILAVLIARLGWLQRYWPLTIALAISVVAGFARLVSGIHLEAVVAWQALIILYAVSLYVAYGMFRKGVREPALAAAPLYLGHLSTMAGAVHLLDSRVLISIIWGLLAVVCLTVSVTVGDKVLGKSALAVFGAFAVKVLLLDLSGASPLVRIGCLVVLGVTLYVGGLLYQKIERPSSAVPQG